MLHVSPGLCDNQMFGHGQAGGLSITVGGCRNARRENPWEGAVPVAVEKS